MVPTTSIRKTDSPAINQAISDEELASGSLSGVGYMCIDGIGVDGPGGKSTAAWSNELNTPLHALKV